MKLNFIEKFIGSGFLTGYIPFASGSFASLAALLIYFIPGFENPFVLLPMIAVFFAAGIFLGNKFEAIYGEDPPQCTVDEVVGMWITLILIPKSIAAAVLCFFVWRILDIIKPFPSRQSEKIKGGPGIMLDDVIAALYALGISHAVIFLLGGYINFGQ